MPRYDIIREEPDTKNDAEQRLNAVEEQIHKLQLQCGDSLMEMMATRHCALLESLLGLGAEIATLKMKNIELSHTIRCMESIHNEDMEELRAVIDGINFRRGAKKHVWNTQREKAKPECNHAWVGPRDRSYWICTKCLDMCEDLPLRKAEINSSRF